MSAELERLGASSLGEWTPELRQAAAGWLLGYRSLHTRAAYAADLGEWVTFCRSHGVDPVRAGRAHVDAWARSLEAAGRKPATVARKLSAVASWYRWLVTEELVAASPVYPVR